MKKRICYVEISSPSGEKIIRNIAIKGNVIRKMGSVTAEAKVSLANLNKDDIEYLSTYMSPYVDHSKNKTMKIYAGYEESGYGVIFDGDITSAIPKNGVDIWLDIEAKSNYFNRQNIITFSIDSPIEVEKFAQKIAELLCVTLQWRSNSKKYIDSFVFSGAKAKLIDELNKYGDFIAFLDNGVLKVLDKESVATQDGSSDGVKLVNSFSGLIGSPSITEHGVSFKTLLDPVLSPGDLVRLESEKYPVLDGLYQICELKFNFSTHSKEFYCEIKSKKEWSSNL